MEGYAFVDGTVVPLDQAQVPLVDRGHLLGDGVFETLRAIDGQILFADRHEARLRHGLQVLGIDDTVVAEYQLACHRLVEAVDAPDTYLRIQISTGDMHSITAGSAPRITGLARPTQPYPFPAGVRLATSSVRLQRDSPLAGVKNLSFLHYVAARREAMAAGADDALLGNDAGRIAECSTSNIMAYVDGAVHAPGIEEGALGGVTRDVVLECVQEMGLPIETRLESSMLAHAEAVWATNTTGGIVPVLSIDDRPVPQSDLLARLQAAYAARCR